MSINDVLLGLKPSEEHVEEKGCPPLYLASRVCICIDCPRKGRCLLEDISRKTGCNRFMRACSVRFMDKGEPPGCDKFIMEELSEIWDKKYL